MQDPRSGDIPGAAEASPSEELGAHTSSVTVRGPLTEEVAVTLKTSPSALRPAQSWPTLRFEDSGEIARGGMSSVRKVFDKLILRELAMKVLDPARGAGELAHFVEEAQITGQLDHPNIVPVHDIELDEEGLPTRFTMKLVRGQTLEALAREQSTAPLASDRSEELLQVFLRVCDAVAFAHSRGVIHRDLKPANVMVGAHGQVYVMDWGIALLREGERAGDPTALPRIQHSGDTLPELQGSLTGTPSYMAPEQAWGRIADIDERTDVYGLGGILYYLLTLRPPHDGRNAEEALRMAQTGQVTAPDAISGEVVLPPLLCGITMRALSPHPADRHASVIELKREVEAFLRGGGWFGQQRFSKGTVILEEGGSPDAAYIIQEGECDLFKAIAGEQSFVCTLGPGEVFGETAIFTAGTRTATVIARTDVSTIVVTREALERELDRSPWLRSFVRAVAQRFVEIDRQLSKLRSDRPDCG
ncbi:MAG TPA: cyclic nucleotide-binding domain-containing protein [Polyangiales bacterium]|nr:cyclic nucleotide-binding domain-containing protein [Polyangiales bacterium]